MFRVTKHPSGVRVVTVFWYTFLVFPGGKVRRVR